MVHSEVLRCTASLYKNGVLSYFHLSAVFLAYLEVNEYSLPVKVNEVQGPRAVFIVVTVLTALGVIAVLSDFFIELLWWYGVCL
jgi:hypothetical protein